MGARAAVPPASRACRSLLHSRRPGASCRRPRVDCCRATDGAEAGAAAPDPAGPPCGCRRGPAGAHRAMGSTRCRRDRQQRSIERHRRTCRGLRACPPRRPPSQRRRSRARGLAGNGSGGGRGRSRGDDARVRIGAGGSDGGNRSVSRAVLWGSWTGGGGSLPRCGTRGGPDRALVYHRAVRPPLPRSLASQCRSTGRGRGGGGQHTRRRVVHADPRGAPPFVSGGREEVRQDGRRDQAPYGGLTPVQRVGSDPRTRLSRAPAPPRPFPGSTAGPLPC